MWQWSALGHLPPKSGHLEDKKACTAQLGQHPEVTVGYPLQSDHQPECQGACRVPGMQQKDAKGLQGADETNCELQQQNSDTTAPRDHCRIPKTGKSAQFSAASKGHLEEWHVIP